jgi:hypothetical protein
MKFSAEASFAGVQGRLWAPGSILEYESIILGIVFSFHRDATWYAFSDAAVEGKWAVMVEPNVGTDMFESMPWQRGEPNGGTTDNCVIHQPSYSWAVDVPCHSVYKYVIEFSCPFGQRFNDQGTACIGILESGCLLD